MRQNFAALAVLGLVGVPFVANAITIRDDVSDAASQAFAAQSQFQSVGQIGGASGVLIAPNWVLTAWHVASGFAGNPSAAVFTINGNSYTGAAVFNLAPPGSNVNTVITNGTDLTLVRLTSDVVGVAPAQLYTGTMEVGHTASVIGFGSGGSGTTGASLGGGVKRGMRNSIDLYVEPVPGGDPGQIQGSGSRTNTFIADFDDTTEGHNQVGTADWLDLEGNVAGGDSGGGLFLEENGQFFLAGISSFAGWDVPPAVPFGYGSISGFTSVSGNMGWIQNTINPVPEPATMFALAGLAAVVARRKRK
ncbi:MAG: trypsin-like serine protease [Fimbriimonadaceae bacterium]|nr:trypsin-like serine protease [Fimbriimonadaceae bacterium]